MASMASRPDSEDLLELDAIRQDRWEVRSESEDDRDRLPT